jgi:hypothetical protein
MAHCIGLIAESVIEVFPTRRFRFIGGGSFWAR